MRIFLLLVSICCLAVFVLAAFTEVDVNKWLLAISFLAISFSCFYLYRKGEKTTKS